MPDFRAFATPATSEPVEIPLSPEESHHLVAVNRARVGDTVVAFDGRGTEWICRLASDRKNAAVLQVRFQQKIKPLPYEITLGQALPKGQFMDAIVRKATELGAARIVPLESERTQIHLDEARSDKAAGSYDGHFHRDATSPASAKASRRPSSASLDVSHGKSMRLRWR